jgi:hypothetical protein
VFDPVDMTFTLLWRDGGGDHPIATWMHHFDPPASGFDAVPYEEDQPGVDAPAKKGDLLVLRFSAASTSTGSNLFVPNGDGSNSSGRIPNLTLPK